MRVSAVCACRPCVHICACVSAVRVMYVISVFTYEARRGRIGLDALLRVALDHIPQSPHVAGVEDVEGLLGLLPPALHIGPKEVVVRAGVPLRRQGERERVSGNICRSHHEMRTDFSVFDPTEGNLSQENSSPGSLTLNNVEFMLGCCLYIKVSFLKRVEWLLVVITAGWR